MMEKINSLSVGTIVRTILQFLAYINQVIAVVGSTTFAQSPYYQWVSVGVTILITVLTYWYNNDWTHLAQSTGDIFKMVKDGKITEDELKEFIEKHKKEE